MRNLYVGQILLLSVMTAVHAICVLLGYPRVVVIEYTSNVILGGMGLAIICLITGACSLAFRLPEWTDLVFGYVRFREWFAISIPIFCSSQISNSTKAFSFIEWVFILAVIPSLVSLVYSGFFTLNHLGCLLSFVVTNGSIIAMLRMHSEPDWLFGLGGVILLAGTSIISRTSIWFQEVSRIDSPMDVISRSLPRDDRWD